MYVTKVYFIFIFTMQRDRCLMLLERRELSQPVAVAVGCCRGRSCRGRELSQPGAVAAGCCRQGTVAIGRSTSWLCFGGAEYENWRNRRLLGFTVGSARHLRRSQRALQSSARAATEAAIIVSDRGDPSPWKGKTSESITFASKKIFTNFEFSASKLSNYTIY